MSKSKDHQSKGDPKKIIPHASLSDKASKRVIAPYVRIVRKGQKPPAEEEDKKFAFFLQKKPSVLLRDLSSFLSDSLDLPSLLHETSVVLKKVTKSTAVTLYMMDSARNEIFISHKISSDERHKIRWKIEEGTTVAAYVANRKEYVMVEDILEDERFPEGVGYEGETIRSVLCVPVVTPDGDCFAVIELYRQLFNLPYSNDDLKIAIVVTGWMGAAIHQNHQRLALQRQQELNDYLLDLTKCYFGDTVHLDKMITEVLKFAQVTMGAERGTVFIIDKDKESKEMVADMYDEGGRETEYGGYKRAAKVKLGERGITGIVARTGITINIKDAYTDTRFNKEVDQKIGVITRSILCMPIVGVEGILGVIQVRNKLTGGIFSPTDETLFKTFSSYVALALQYTRSLTKMTNTGNLNNLYKRILQLQQRPCIHDFTQLYEKPHLKAPIDFDSFRWYINPREHDKIPQLCIYMFTKIIGESQLSMRNLTRFVLSVRKLYRNIPFHNYEHAFNTLHCMYVILKTNPTVFTDLEKKALMVAAICHDVDHPGYTNNFLQLIDDNLAHLYSNSILENHQCDVTEWLIQDCIIYKNLTEDDFKNLCNEVKSIILATDLETYFRNKSKLERIINEDGFDWTVQTHRDCAKIILITSCNLSGHCKPYFISKRIIDCMLAELYEQGDKEKEMELCCLSTTDREQTATLPEDQLNFLTVTVIPCVEILKTVLPNTRKLFEDAMTLRNTWQELIDVRGMKCWRQDNSISAKYK